MSLYHLYLSSPEGQTEALQFTGANAGRALELAHRHGFGGAAELWCNGRRVCNLEYSERFGYWTIKPAKSAKTSAPASSND